MEQLTAGDHASPPAAATNEIIPCHPDHIKEVWPIILPWLKKALSYGPELYTTNSIREMIEKKEMILWLAIKDGKQIIGFAIVSLKQYPLARVCDIHWCGGAVHEGIIWIADMKAELTAWAKRHECSKLGGGGRRGWVRTLGFTECGVMFEMEI